MKTKLFATALIVSCSLVVGAVSVAQADDVADALGGRHYSATVEQLETIAGGTDALVKRLLELRTQEEPAFVGLRAEKLLLTFAEREDVLAALEEDLGTASHKGLAQLIAIHLDQVKLPEARLRLARGVLSRSKTDATYRSFAESLRSSSDPAVNQVARQALGES